MKSNAAFLLLLLLLMMMILNHGYSSRHNLSRHCLAFTTIRSYNSRTFITSQTIGESHRRNITVYVRPGLQGLKGVELVAGIDGVDGVYSWFPLEKKCFTDDFDWWEVTSSVLIFDYNYHNTGLYDLNFLLWTAGCSRWCSKTVSSPRVVSLFAFGFGSAEWRLSLPQTPCITSKVSHYGYPTSHATVCTEFPHTVTGDSSNTDLPSQCSAQGHVSGPDSTANISYVQRKEAETSLRGNLWVRPGQDFKGVNLMVMVLGDGGSSESHTAWFPWYWMCFPEHAHWWEMYVKAQIMTDPTSNNVYHQLKFLVWTGNCPIMCVKNIALTSITQLSVTVHGTLAWRTSEPDHTCTTVGIVSPAKGSKFKSCMTPPRTKTTPTPAHTSQKPPIPPVTPPTTRPPNTSSTTPTPISTTTPTIFTTIESTSPAVTEIVSAVVTVIVVMVVVVVVVIVVVVRRRRGESTAAEEVTLRPHNTESARQENVIVNSLYEPFDRQGATINSLYEPFDRQGATVNSLYEPFDRQGATVKSLDESADEHVSVNSLYEPFENIKPNQ